MVLVLVLAVALLGLSVSLAARVLVVGRERNRAALAQIGRWGFEANIDRVGPVPDQGPFGRLSLHVGKLLEGRLRTSSRLEIRKMLNSAGLYRWTIARYLGYRAVAAVGLPFVFIVIGAIGGALSATGIVLALAFGGLGWVGVPFMIKRKATARLEQIDHEVPELVDLLVTTVEAGVGFTASLQLSARRTKGPLGEELRLMLREQSMGLSSNESLNNLLTRAGSPALAAFVQAILQGEVLGVSIGRILRELAVDMRKRRRQAAEERAQKAPIKLLFPLVILILPAMFIVLLGPAVYAFIHQLSNGF
jgi:tight adherence protein C